MEKKQYTGSAANYVHCLCIRLKKPVRQGNEIRIKSENTVVDCVTDSNGSTYTQISPNEWRTYNVRGGMMCVTVDFETANYKEGKVTVEEWGI